VLCGVIGDQLIGPYIFLQLLTGDIYAKSFARWTANTFRECSSTNTTTDILPTWRRAPHFSQVVKQRLNHKFPNRRIGRGDAQNWPPRSQDLNPLDYHVWGYMKSMVYAHKVNTREELIQRLLSAARSINNTAVLRKVTSSLVIRVRKSTQADGGHFEQFAWVLNGQSVTVHLTTYLNKCTIFLFPFKFVHCTLKTHNSWNVESDPRVYDVIDSESTLELNPEVVTLNSETLYIYIYICLYRITYVLTCIRQYRHIYKGYSIIYLLK